MQLSPSTQSRRWIKFHEYRNAARKQKQNKRMEEQKQYMELLRKRKEEATKEKQEKRAYPDKLSDTIIYLNDSKQIFDIGYSAKPITLSLTSKFFILSYFVFLFASLLFFVTPGLDKQLLGHQFYQIIESNHDIQIKQFDASSPLNPTLVSSILSLFLPDNDLAIAPTLSLDVGNIALVKRTLFIDLAKNDIFVYESKQQRSTYHVAQVKHMDVANYQVTYQKDGSPHIIPKEQIKGLVVLTLANYVEETNLAITILSYFNGVLLILFLIQAGYYISYRRSFEDQHALLDHRGGSTRRRK